MRYILVGGEMKKENANVRRSYGRTCSIFFVRPKSMANAHEAAKRFMGIRHVKEVFVTEGKYGFVVRTMDLGLEEEKEVGRIMSKAAGPGLAKMTCYYPYRK